MAEDVITLITADHRQVENIFDRLKSGSGDRAQLVEELCALLIAHAHAEEERVYPLIARKAPDEKDTVHHSEEEHEEAERLVRRLQSMPPDSADFESVLDELVGSVTHHVETEESEVLPALREAVDGRQLTKLGEAFTERRTQVLSELAGEARTRDELYEEARAEGIEGRSKMKKDELAEALRESQAGG